MPRSHPNADGLSDHVEARLREFGIRRGDAIVVAVSGGVDSVVLLDVLHRLSESLQLRLSVVHLDHRLRPDSADDATFVASLATRLGWPITVESMDVANWAQERGLSVEQAGRACRRDLWTRVRLQVGARWVAVGHHADDQAETVLLRLLRGAGTTGLGAMRPAGADGIVRPMLKVRRSAIEAYAANRDLQVHEDPMNQDREIPRNRVRHQLLPLLESRHNPRIVEGLIRNAHVLQADDDYLDSLSREVADTLFKVRGAACVTLDTVGLRRYHIAVQRRVLRQYIQELAQNRPIGFAAVEGLIDRLTADLVGMHDVTGGIRAQITDTELILRRGLAPAVHARVELPGQTAVPERAKSLHATFVSRAAYAGLRNGLGAWRAAFDARVTEGLLLLRTPQPGDRLRPLGMGGHHKKLSDCLIDAKWPRILRADTLLLTCVAADGDEEVLWVAGLTRSEAFRVTGETDRILYLEFVDAGSPESDAPNPLTDGPMD